MKITAILIKNLKRLKRDKTNLFLIIIFPILLMLVYSTLSGSLLDVETINVGILNLDDGNSSKELISMIGSVHIDNESNNFNIVNLDNESDGNEKLKNEVISSIIIIPSNYSKYVNNTNVDSNLMIVGEPTSSEYMITLSSLNIILQEYSNTLYENITHNHVKQFHVIPNQLNGTDSFNMFDYLAPGLIVFSILINISSIASNISEETENGMLKRLKLSKMKSRDYVIGTISSWILIGAIEIIVVLLAAIFLGFHWQGGLISLILAVITGVLTMISSISVAMIIVSITKSTSQAATLSSIIAFPLSFICGSFFPLPEFYIGVINGHPTQIYEVLPWNQTILIFRQLLTFGKGFNEIYINILFIIISGLILLTLSIILFRRKINNTI